MTRAWALITVALACVASSCAVSGLSFVQDHRVRISAPVENERIELPLRIEWEARGYDGYFGVFIDQAPMRPNQGLQALVPDGDPCLTRPVCPDVDWLATHYVFVTKQTSLTVQVVPDFRPNKRSSDLHRLTIVLLDARGRRTGESAFLREFVVERDR